MNSVILIGRLTKDPELSHSSAKTPYCSFNIAVDRGRDKNGNELEADFPRVTAFGKTAENMAKYVQKGNLICVNGELRTGKYEKDGKTRYTTEVIARNVQFLQWKKKEEGSGSSEKEPTEIPEGFQSLTEDDLPF